MILNVFHASIYSMLEKYMERNNINNYNYYNIVICIRLQERSKTFYVYVVLGDMILQVECLIKPKLKTGTKHIFMLSSFMTQEKFLLLHILKFLIVF